MHGFSVLVCVHVCVQVYICVHCPFRPSGRDYVCVSVCVCGLMQCSQPLTLLPAHLSDSG